jgi:glycerate kinase
VTPRATARPVVVAPDKFKGTLSAPGAAAAIGRGLVRAGFGAIDLLPVADGGEGTMDALAAALHARIVAAQAADPLGRPVTAAFALAEDGRLAILEAAQASGLWRLAEFERDALGATTTGTGELIGAAIDAGAREVIVGVGGSATTDGGRGALEALGARFSKRRADMSEVRRRLRGVRLSVACDVRNPLLGPAGAARIFGPQKGANAEQVEELEARLREWAALARRTADRDPSEVQMAGAAGGLAGGLWAFAGAQLRPGAPLVLELVGFDARAQQACMVVTGEGRLDDQTLGGKAVFEVATRSRQAGVPCYVVPGEDALDAFGKRLLNVEAEGAGRGPGTPAERLEEAARRMARRQAPYLASASARTTAS